MATAGIIVLVIVIVLLVGAGVAGTMLLRRRRLRQRFGPEYDQLASEVGERQAQAELSERERRVAHLDIHQLSPERRAGYARQWTSLQEMFIDSPPQALEAAATLVSAVAADRGYPADDETRLLDDLSVHHSDRIDGYRQARQISNRAGRTGTEDLRQALLGYRALFRDLLGAETGAGRAADEAVPTETGPAETGPADTEPTAPAASGAGQPAAAAARNSESRGSATDGTTTAVTDGTDSGSAADGDDDWVDSGRDDAAAPALREE